MRHRALPLFVLLLTLSPFVARAATDAEKAICPVCRVHEGETEAEDVAASLEHDGHTYGFCSEGCRDKFLEAPEAYLPPVFPRSAPSFRVRDLSGDDFSSEELRGRTVLLDFWATWCQPCVDDLPRLSRLHERYFDRGLSVVSVSTDEGDGAARKVARILKRRKASHPNYLDATDSPAWAAYRVRVVPAQFLIDAGGDIVAQWSGRIDLEEVEAAITRLLAEGDEPRL